MKKMLMLAGLALLTICQGATAQCVPVPVPGTGSSTPYRVLVDGVGRSSHAREATAFVAAADSLRIRPDATVQVTALYVARWEDEGQPCEPAEAPPAGGVDTVVVTDTVTVVDTVAVVDTVTVPAEECPDGWWCTPMVMEALAVPWGEDRAMGYGEDGELLIEIPAGETIQFYALHRYAIDESYYIAMATGWLGVDWEESRGWVCVLDPRATVDATNDTIPGGAGTEPPVCGEDLASPTDPPDTHPYILHVQTSGPHTFTGIPESLAAGDSVWLQLSRDDWETWRDQPSTEPDSVVWDVAYCDDPAACDFERRVDTTRAYEYREQGSVVGEGTMRIQVHVIGSSDVPDRVMTWEVPVVVPSGAAHPNEPPGFRVIAESDFDCLPGDGCEAHGEWTRRRNANMTLIPSTAP